MGWRAVTATARGKYRIQDFGWWRTRGGALEHCIHMIRHGRSCAMYDFVVACVLACSLVCCCPCSSTPFLPYYNMSCHDLHSGRVLGPEYEGTRSGVGSWKYKDGQDLELRLALGLWPGLLHTSLLLLAPSSTARFVGTTITRCGFVLSLIATAVVRAPQYEPSDS